jgi:hypothetical protein
LMCPCPLLLLLLLLMMIVLLFVGRRLEWFAAGPLLAEEAVGAVGAAVEAGVLVFLPEYQSIDTALVTVLPHVVLAAVKKVAAVEGEEGEGEVLGSYRYWARCLGLHYLGNSRDQRRKRRRQEPAVLLSLLTCFRVLLLLLLMLIIIMDLNRWAECVHQKAMYVLLWLMFEVAQ